LNFDFIATNVLFKTIMLFSTILFLFLKYNQTSFYKRSCSKDTIDLQFISTDEQLADIFTNPLLKNILII